MERVQYRILKWIADARGGSDGGIPQDNYSGANKLDVLLGPGWREAVRGKRIIDFGCGHGFESVALAEAGAERVTGIDSRQDDALEAGRELARARGVAERCEFASQTDEQADIVLSLDSFEHFAEPEMVLRAMLARLRPDGYIWVSFGPTWYHPLGGHLIKPVLPWAHLVFSESALMRWRADLRSDGAKTFAEAGLNQMTIGRFERLVKASGCTIDLLEVVPIRSLAAVHSRWTREFTTSVVKCKLRRHY